MLGRSFPVERRSTERARSCGEAADCESCARGITYRGDDVTAEALVAEIRARGGRVHRTQGTAVFAVVSDRALAERLAALGATVIDYMRDHRTGLVEYDVSLGRVQLDDDDVLALWKAAAPITDDA